MSTEAQEPIADRRILVAEDSSITQDLLKLILGQRGYQVDIVDDGVAALEALQQHAYHVALLDFHLPGMDGVQVVSAFETGNAGKARPYFIAVTADVEGLLAHDENCERFDRIVPKPVDIQEVCKAIEEADAAPERVSAPQDSTASEPVEPEAKARSENSAADLPPFLPVDYKFLIWPEDFNSKHLTARTSQHQDVDAILVRHGAAVKDLVMLWTTPGLHLLPVIDLSGAFGAKADLDASSLGHSETGRIVDIIEAFHDRRARLHRDLLLTEEPDAKLLGRIFIIDRPLTPAYDSAHPTITAYNVLLDSQTVINEAKKLTDKGLLAPSFFDRVHVCDGCGSSRFNVREECPECRASNLSEESYLHHFRCAFQGPESDFRRQDDLICPKCRRELSHFGHDYDRPGTLITCASCAHSTSEPTVGFICLDCGARTDGDRARTRDIASYALTDEASAFLEVGQAFFGFSQSSLRFSDLPLDLVVALNEDAKRFNQDGTPFALLEIRYRNERDIDREHGPRQFSQLRNLFIENLRSELSRQIDDIDGVKVASGQAFDFALLGGVGSEHVQDHLDKICAQASGHLRLDPGVDISVFAPEDLT